MLRNILLKIQVIDCIKISQCNNQKILCIINVMILLTNICILDISDFYIFQINKSKDKVFIWYKKSKKILN